MAKATPPRKKKLNQAETEKKIQTDLLKRYTHIIPREDAIEFVLPEQNPLNRSLFHELPLVNVTPEGKFSPEGTYGELLYFYFPKSKYNSLTALLEKYQIPEEMHNDLRVAYLSMFSSHCTAASSTNTYEELERNQKELFAAIDFLESCAEKRILIRGVSLEFKDRLEGKNEKGQPNFGTLKSRKFKGHLAAQLIEGALQNYKACKTYEVAQRLYDSHKEYGKPDMFFGHKNLEKASQSYFAKVTFKYLKNRLFNSAFHLWGKPVEYEAEIVKLRKLYSRRKMFLFIGEMMILSELLEMKKDDDDEAIIELIEKKLTPLIRATKKKVEGIEERNEKSTDGSYEITMFGDLF